MLTFLKFIKFVLWEYNNIGTYDKSYDAFLKRLIKNKDKYKYEFKDVRLYGFCIVIHTNVDEDIVIVYNDGFLGCLGKIGHFVNNKEINHDYLVKPKISTAFEFYQAFPFKAVPVVKDNWMDKLP